MIGTDEVMPRGKNHPFPPLRANLSGLACRAMNRRSVILKAALVLMMVWAVVWSIRAWAGSRKITAERVQSRIEAANFADWSDKNVPDESPEGKRRLKTISEIADMVKRLDFQEREKNRRNRGGEEFFRKLNTSEKKLFIDLTVMESMNRFMESLEAMPPEQRRKFVEQGLKEVEAGRTAEEMAKADQLGADLLEKISQEGMRAYFEKSSTQTKLDLAPLMEAINETMQGLRGNEFGPRTQ
jgi:hypothetical protein